MKMFNKKAGIKKLVLLTNMALMSFIMPTVANAESLTPTLGNNSAYTWTKIDSELSNTVSRYVYDKTTGTMQKEYWQWALRPGIYSASRRTVQQFETIDEIVSSFIGNSSYVADEHGIKIGGAIDNWGTITSITADFIGNCINEGVGCAYGGAIYNNSTIGDITGDFIGNYTKPETGSGSGGAIFNCYDATIGDIKGDFISNYSVASGGAIYNSNGTIGNITGDFISNYVASDGGAIMNGGTIGEINGSFLNNYVQGSYSAYGGAIYNHYTIDDITGDFIGNYAKSSSSYAYGGAIYNCGTIGEINGSFLNNYVQGSYSAYGGAIYNNGTIGSIVGDFIGNYAKSETSIAYGGAIYNCDTIGEINGSFLNNYVQGSTYAYGGAIYNNGSAKIGDITGDFLNNYVQGSTYAYGGAIYNNGTIGSQDANGNLTGGLINSSFINNYAKSESGTAEGGAIRTNKDMNFIAQDGYTSVISGNYVEDKDGKRAEAIRVVTPTSSTAVGSKPINGTTTKKYIYEYKTPTFSLINNTNSKTIIDDQIVGTSAEGTEGAYYTSNGVKQYVELNEDGTYHHIDTPEAKVVNSKLNITGDGTGLVQLNNDVINMDVSLTNSTLHLGSRDNVLDNNNLTINSGTLSMINNNAGTMTLSSLTVQGDTILAIDVDFANKTSDTITTTNALTGVVTITEVNALGSSTQPIIVKVLNVQNSDLQLALSNEINSQMATTGEACLNEKSTIIGSVAIKQLTNWDDVYAEWEEYSRTYGTLKLATSSTANDSIEVSVSRVESGTEVIAQYDDTLAYVNQNAGDYSEREFKFDSAENVYTVKENLGNTAGKLTVNGVADGDKKSTIDVNGKNGFVLNNRDANLVLNNVVVKNANNSAVKSSSDAQGSFNNVEFANNTISAQDAMGGAISNNSYGKLNDITNSTFTNNNVTGTRWVEGGAIWNSNYSKIGNISANFYYNSAISNTTDTDKPAKGGAIYNNWSSTIASIAGEFVGNKVKGLNAHGGAIFNNASATITSINGTFENNYAEATTEAQGGAIWNAANIGTIDADFTGNYAKVTSSEGNAQGGAIYNTGTIDTLNGDFSENYAQGSGNFAYAEGGAIYNAGTIETLTGDFIGNFAKSNDASVEGGAIYNAGTIETITGDFIGNYAVLTGTSGSAYGGAIDNYVNETIGSITGDFIDNYAESAKSSAYGGAINNSGTITSITGDFIGNYAKSETSIAYGGAIYNSYNSTMGDITGDFIGNYAKSEADSAYGGAIYTSKDLKFVAHNRTNTFSGNYIQVGDGEKQYEAIYVDSADATLTFNATNGGKFVMNDYTNGQTGYNVKLTGDGTGTFELNNQLKGADVTTENITVDLANDKLDNYTFNTLTSSSNTKYELDVDFANKTSDTIITTNASTGVITIYALNILGNPNPLTTDYKLQILKTQNSDLQLALSNEIKSQLTNYGEVEIGTKLVNSTIAPVKRVTNWNDTYAIWNMYEKAYGTLGLATTNTTNDSIGVSVSRVENSDWLDAGVVNDTLAYVNQNASVYEEREFNFDSAENVYEVKENLGNTAGKLTVNGVADGEDKSTIDINNKSGFVVNNSGAELTINNVELKNSNGPAVMITSGKAALNNVDFTSNTTTASSGTVRGGAIHNKGAVISEVSGNFSANSVTSNSGDALGGAISNNGATVEKITDSTFVGNTVKATGWSEGGAIWHSNGSTLGDVEADFVNNSVTGENATAQGGAIYVNSSTVGNIVGDFINNYAKGATVNGGAIMNNNRGSIASITGDFLNNTAEGTSHVQGGAIFNKGANIGVISGKFVGNSAKTTNGDAIGGAVHNNGATIIEIKNSYFANNKVEGSRWVEGGALWGSKYSTIGNVEADFVENAAISTGNTAQGGAVYLNEGTLGEKDDNNNVIGGFINSSFVGNHAESATGTAKGGALYTKINVNMFADGKDVQIRDNYTMSNGVKDDNAIYVDNANATLTFNIKNNGSILLKDNIDGATGYKFNVTGDNTGMFYLQNDIRNANVSMGGITLNTINNQVFTNHFNSFTLTDTINMAVDVDLANGTMDRISADTFGEHNGSLNVIGMNLLSDMASDVYTKNILFAEGSLKEQVTLSVNNLPDSNFQTTLLTPIYKYNVSYDKSGENGMFVFARPTAGGTGSTGNASDAFNPAILAGSTSAAVGAVGTVNQAVHHSFNNVDAYMNIPYMERMAMKRRNHYALAGVPDDVRQLGKYSPLYLPGDEEESVWVKPYTTFESVPLKNGPKVSNISYGTLVGFDSQMQSLRHGWDRVISGYVGYTGASQRYSGVDATQNGGILGGTVTLYKGNFFNATTLNVGSSVSQNETMYGKDDYTMLMSGIANKTGYNLEFKDGKVILQPSMLVGYTFVNTFDYTNAAGVKIDNKPLHTIQVSPGVKVIGNLKHGWQPYASVNMVWNLMGEYDATANGVKLPEMKVKPYVQYGVGLQKRVKDHFMAYGQAMLHNGGRNGISLTAGFRWALGHKDNCDYEIPEIKSDKKAVKVKTNKKAKQTEVKPEKKVLKELSSERKAQIILADKNSFKINKN